MSFTKAAILTAALVVKARAEIKAGTQTGYNEVCDTEKVEHMKQHEKLPVAVGINRPV